MADNGDANASDNAYKGQKHEASGEGLRDLPDHVLPKREASDVSHCVRGIYTSDAVTSAVRVSHDSGKIPPCLDQWTRLT